VKNTGVCSATPNAFGGYHLSPGEAIRMNQQRNFSTLSGKHWTSFTWNMTHSLTMISRKSSGIGLCRGDSGHSNRPNHEGQSFMEMVKKRHTSRECRKRISVFCPPTQWVDHHLTGWSMSVGGNTYLTSVVGGAV
jgi:hypothetical protein